MGYRFQQAQRLANWIHAHPDYEAALFAWLEAFQQDPFDPALDRRPFLDGQGRAVPNTFHYVVPEVPIPLVISIEERRRLPAYRFDAVAGTFVEYPQDDPDDPIEDDYGMYARVLWPRRATDELPG